MLRKARSYYQSSSFKMALFFTLMLGLTVCIMGYFIFYFSRGHFIHGTEMTIQNEINHLVKWHDSDGLKNVIDDITIQQNKVFYYGDDMGQYIAGNLSFLPNNFTLLSEGTIVFKDKNKSYAARIHQFSDGTKILVGLNIDDIRKNYIFMTGLSIASILFVAIVIFTSFIISVFVVSRTNRIAFAAKEIMDTGNLSKRIEVDSKWDDLSYVATVINSFLSRIELLVQNVRQVSDNIAHDLRTPLTRLRNDLEKLRDEGENSEKFEKVIAESDHVLNIFSALLRISKVESGQGKEYFKDINLSDILKDVIDLYEPLAEEKNIHFLIQLDNYNYFCDKDLLFQFFANLFDNAIKFTPKNGKIDISLDKNGIFSICDNGIGVPDNDIDKIFRRFYRAEQTRSKSGHGLGLSLVEAIARLHGLIMVVSNNSPGLIISTNFGVLSNITKV